MSERAVTIRLSAVDEFTPTFDTFTQNLTDAELFTRSAAQAASDAANAYQLLAGAMTTLNTPTDPNAAQPANQPGMSFDLESMNVAAGSLAILSDEAAQYQEAMLLANDSTGALAAELPSVVDGAASMRAEMQGAELAVGAMRDVVGELTSKVNNVRVRLLVDDPKNLLGILGGGIDSGLLQLIRDGGGSVPGGDGRSPGSLSPVSG
jgi:hypothetical protein